MFLSVLYTCAHPMISVLLCTFLRLLLSHLFMLHVLLDENLNLTRNN